jgi:hypothetical protein
MKISFSIDSAAARAQLRQWGGAFREKVKVATAKAITAQAAEIKTEVRAHVMAHMAVVKKSFLSAFTARMINKDPTRLPALYVGAKLDWAGMHEYGGQIGAKMLIPLHGRVGAKQFKAQIAQLMRGVNGQKGAYFIKNAKGNIVLMAENTKEHAQPLAGFKRRYRKAEGIKRLKRGADIPIAVLVPRVVIKKRLDVEKLVEAHIPRLAVAIEASLHPLN